MVSFTILAGGYDTFVAAYLFNSDASTLALTSRSPTGINPSWLALHPTNRSVLYAVNEFDQGAVQSFTVSPEGVLSAPIDIVSSGGGSPAHAVALSTGQVAVTNYVGANARIIPTSDTFVEFDASAGITAFPIPVNGTSHPHQAVEFGSEVFIPDLGADTIWRLTESDSPGDWEITGSIAQPTGSGPRHIAIRDGYLYTLHELASTLSVQPIPKAPNGTSTVTSLVSIVPSDPPPNAVWAAAEILIPPTSRKFPTPYIYVSNRNVGQVDPEGRGDTIAIFEHVNKGRRNEKLKLVAQVYTGLEQVRGMEIGSACKGGEEYLVASGVAGTGGVAVFRRIQQGRNLVEVGRNTEVATRTSLTWLC